MMTTMIRLLQSLVLGWGPSSNIAPAQQKAFFSS
jgi:hypothetical protein